MQIKYCRFLPSGESRQFAISPLFDLFQQARQVKQTVDFCVLSM